MEIIVQHYFHGNQQSRLDSDGCSSQVWTECSPSKIIVGWIERRERTEAECDAAALHGVCAHVSHRFGSGCVLQACALEPLVINPVHGQLKDPADAL